MKFGVFGCRHPHLELAVEEMLKLGHQCIGIYEPEGPLARKMSEKYDLPWIETEQQFFNLKPEIALCSSINSEKVQKIETCCRQGVHIMLDKPLVTSLADYEKILKASAKSDIKIGLMLTERFNPPVCRLKELIEEGRLGKVVSLTFSKPHKLTPETRENWHFDKRQNGGPIVDLMIHDFDLVRWLTGSEVARTVGMMKVGDRQEYPDLYDDARLLVQMKNGVTATLMADWWTPASYHFFGDERIVCTGTIGRCVAYLTGEPVLHPEPFLALSTETEAEIILSGSPAPKGMMEDFLDQIAGRPSIITQEDIFKATYETLAADRAVQIIKNIGGGQQ